MLQIFQDKAQISKVVADLFLKMAQEAVQEQGRFTVALTGGTSPVLLHQLLAQPPYLEQIPWNKTFVFWGDERWVPMTDDRSNARMAMETLLNKVPVPKEHIYPMWQNDIEPEAFATQYEDILKQHFIGSAPRFDLILLGMGDDGHTASLFPQTEVLKEKNKWVSAYYLGPQSMYRVTLTAPLINQAKNICFLAFGENKAKALYEVLEGAPNPEQYPSQLIKPAEGNVYWMVDAGAASLLQNKH